MTKAELVEKISSEGGIIKSQAEKAVDGFVATVSAALAGGDKITLGGVSGLSVTVQGLNVKAAIHGLAKRSQFRSQKVVKFKAGKTLSEKVK